MINSTIDILLKIAHTLRHYSLTANVLGLCEGGELEVQMFNLAEMLIRIPMLKFSTNAPLLQNPCARCTTTQMYTFSCLKWIFGRQKGCLT